MISRAVVEFLPLLELSFSGLRFIRNLLGSTSHGQGDLYDVVRAESLGGLLNAGRENH